ncbi:MAG: hypothetical protein AAGB13_01555 [Cyanobacteria bacterium P01_F01_bin.33]
MPGPTVLTVEHIVSDPSAPSGWWQQARSAASLERFIIKVNGNVVAECKTYADAQDFMQQWEEQARHFRSGYEIHPDPIAVTPSRRSLHRTAAGQLLQDDPWAAEAYGVAALRSLLDSHGWTEAQVRQLCDYAISADFEAWQQRRHLPHRREVTPRPNSWFNFFR